MSTRGGLGRGLGALIPTGARSLEELATDSIRPNPDQPRKSFDKESIASLAASIRQLGLLQPVVVRRTGTGEFQIVMGERRWRAAQRAGLTTVPAVIVETDDRGALERALVENLHREDLTPIEEAHGYKQLIEEAGLTHEQLAEKVGLSRPAVSNALRLLDLSAVVQGLLGERKITAGHARALLGMGTNPMVERLAQRVAAEQMSVRETEDLVRRYATSAAPDTTDRPTRQAPIGMPELEERLSDSLSTRVKVLRGKRKGKIVIEFGSLKDLERILAILTPDASKDGDGAI